MFRANLHISRMEIFLKYKKHCDIWGSLVSMEKQNLASMGFFCYITDYK